MFKKIFVSICSIVTIVLCTLGIVGCNTQESVSNDDKNVGNFTVIIDDEIKSEIDSEEIGSISEPVLKLSSTVNTISNGIESVNLKATVLPENAINHDVVWSIAWSDDALRYDENVTDYVNFVVDPSDSTQITVSCYKHFGNDSIIITVTTVNGGYNASCICTFMGKPTTISIDYEEYISDNVGAYAVANLACGTTYLFDIVQNNNYDYISDKYISNLGYSSFAQGGIKVHHKVSQRSGQTSSVLVDEIKSISLNSFTTYDGTTINLFDYIFDISIVNNQLSITPKILIENLNIVLHPSGSITETITFSSYITEYVPFLGLHIHDDNDASNEFAEICIRASSDVSGVSLNNEAIEF